MRKFRYVFYTFFAFMATHIVFVRFINPKNSLQKPKSNFYFLPILRAGSSTVIPIFQKMALRYGMDAFFAEDEVGLGESVSLEDCYFGSESGEKDFQLMFEKCVYNKTVVETTLGKNTKKISILRSPDELILSTWDFYRHQNKLHNVISMIEDRFGDSTNEEAFNHFVNNYELLIATDPHLSHAFENPQASMFTDDFILLANIADLIHFISHEFDLILITEKLEESLAVMMVKFDLTLEDIVTLKQNQFRSDDKLSRATISSVSKSKILEMTELDHQIYR